MAEPNELKAACERLKHIKSMIQQKSVDYAPNQHPARGNKKEAEDLKNNGPALQ